MTIDQQLQLHSGITNAVPIVDYRCTATTKRQLPPSTQEPISKKLNLHGFTRIPLQFSSPPNSPDISKIQVPIPSPAIQLPAAASPSDGTVPINAQRTNSARLNRMKQILREVSQMCNELVLQMMWNELEDDDAQQRNGGADQQQYSHINFDFSSALSKPKDYYRILDVDYDATDDAIRSNYIRLALKWHPDKKNDQDCATSKFQEINEAYQVLSDPVKRREYDKKGILYAYDYNIIEYLHRYKGLILTCSGLGMKHSMW